MWCGSFENGEPPQVSSSSLDRGSKLRGPLTALRDCAPSKELRAPTTRYMSEGKLYYNLYEQELGNFKIRARIKQITLEKKTRENAMANAFCVSVRNNISKRWNTTENDVSKNQSSADSAIRLPNTSTLNSNAADITEYFLDVYQTTLY
ncbi:hypothetical protein TNCV_2345011 [Trichonephila clavipes]|nr:hypothetical protein TNCV_2345011 [Trichonephila clavipes]